MKDRQPIRILCTGSAEMRADQQLRRPVDVGVIFDGQEVRFDCTHALNGECTAATLGIYPCTTGDSIRKAHAQFYSH